MKNKLKIEMTTAGQEIIEELIKDIESQGVKAELSNFKILIKTKEGKDTEITPERLTIVFSK